MMSLHHPNIATVYGYSYTTEHMVLLMEYAPPLNQLYQTPGLLKWQGSREYITVSIFKGLEYLHRKVITHQNLTSRNILVTFDQISNGYTAKIADVGLADARKYIYHELYEDRDPPVVQATYPWRAPEVLKDGFKAYTTAADVYAAAIIMSEIINEKPPYADENQSNASRVVDVVCKNKRPKLLNQCPPDYAILMGKCWSARAEDRLSAKEAAAGVDEMIKGFNK